MSGGAWDYLSYKLEEAAEYIVPALRLLAAIEHEMDWGASCDTCYACAKLRVLAALEQFFSDRATNESAAVAIVRDHKQNRCERCAERTT